MRISAGLFNRRGFIGGIAAVAALSRAQPGLAAAESGSVKLGVATYSLRKFSRTDAIKMIRQLGVSCVNIKEFHLLYKSTPEELAAGREEFRQAGLTTVAGGVITLQRDDDADIRKYFEYAKTCGMPVITVAPTQQTVPRIEKFVKEYNIKVAIHNHGVEDKNFPTPEVALEAVKGRDPRMGLCIDLGYTVRCGVDPAKAIRAAGNRLFDLHIWDVKSATPQGETCPVGDGVSPVPAIFRELMKIGYRGTVDLEYEIEPDNPMPGMIKSFAYMRGVLAGLAG
jgi:sugar phosphate isomerase/epimerase